MASVAESAGLMTIEEPPKLPDGRIARDRIDRLVRLASSAVRSSDGRSSMRNRHRGGIVARIAKSLDIEPGARPGPIGKVACGEAGFIRRLDPDAGVGIDAACG